MCACVYHCAQLLHTMQPSTVLIIFPLILQTIIIAKMLSAGGAERIWLVSKAPPTLQCVFLLVIVTSKATNCTTKNASSLVVHENCS